jgi:carbamoyl-phosphate synthase large subunit
LKVRCILKDDNEYQCVQISGYCAAEFKAKTLLLLFEAEIEKANGERYVDNESIVTDKRK